MNSPTHKQRTANYNRGTALERSVGIQNKTKTLGSHTGKQKKKRVRETLRECYNHKPQPFPGSKRKRNQTKPNKRKSNKRTKSTKISSLFPKRGNRNAKRTEKHKKLHIMSTSLLSKFKFMLQSVWSEKCATGTIYEMFGLNKNVTKFNNGIYM